MLYRELMSFLRKVNKDRLGDVVTFRDNEGNVFEVTGIGESPDFDRLCRVGSLQLEGRQYGGNPGLSDNVVCHVCGENMLWAERGKFWYCSNKQCPKIDDESPGPKVKLY